MRRLIALLLALSAPAYAGTEFDGSTEYLQAGTNIVSVPFTVCTRVWIDAASGAQSFFTLSDVSAANDHHRLGYIAGAGGFVANTSSTNAASAAPSATTWYYVCGVWASSSDRSVWLDGTETNDTTSSTPAGIDETTIGARERNSGVVHFLDGRMAEMGIWDIALADTDIAAYSAGLSPLKIRADQLVSYFEFHDDSHDVMQGATWTATGPPTPIGHPDQPVFYRTGQLLLGVPAAGAPPVGGQPMWLRHLTVPHMGYGQRYPR